MTREHDGLFESLDELSEHSKDIVILSADSISSPTTIECGLAQQNMINVAIGLALCGKVPFCISPAAFNPTRNLAQIKMACMNNANIKIVGTYAGASFGPERGMQAYDDVAILRALPNLTIISPADEAEVKKATIAAATMNGPVYLRIGRDLASTTNKTPFVVGRAEILRAGKDCTIISCGAMVAEAMASAEKLALQEIECTVLNCHTIKPIDKHAIISSARITGCVVTLEEHSVIGGLGSAVAEVLSAYANVPLRSLGLPDSFGSSGTTQELLDANGLSMQHVVKSVKEAIMQKCESLCMETPIEGSRLRLDLNPDLAFKLRSGELIKSLPSLQKALISMDNSTFSHHCNDHKNDFSAWVRGVYKDEPLALALDKTKTRIGMASVLSRWLT